MPVRQFVPSFYRKCPLNGLFEAIVEIAYLFNGHIHKRYLHNNCADLHDQRRFRKPHPAARPLFRAPTGYGA